jgi:hypothetical protein
MSNPNDKVIIRLNADAMNQLFPEGTQARIDLQSAVLNEVSTRFVKGQMTEEIEQHLSLLVAHTAKAVDTEALVKRAFAKKPGWNSQLEVATGSGLALAIGSMVASEFENKLNKMADEAVEKYLPQAMQGIESKVQRVIDSKINEATRELIQKKVNDAVAAAAAVLKG